MRERFLDESESEPEELSELESEVEDEDEESEDEEDDEDDEELDDVELHQLVSQFAANLNEEPQPTV